MVHISTIGQKAPGRLSAGLWGKPLDLQEKLETSVLDNNPLRTHAKGGVKVIEKAMDCVSSDAIRDSIVKIDQDPLTQFVKKGRPRPPIKNKKKGFDRLSEAQNGEHLGAHSCHERKWQGED